MNTKRAALPSQQKKYCSKKPIITSIALTLLAGLMLILAADHSRTGATAGARERNRADVPAWGNSVTVHSAAQGKPWINMLNGRELIAARLDRADSIRPMTEGQTRALSLASADFDGDGVADLACGYKEAAGGSVVLLRGNVDSIYPTAPEARERKLQGVFTDAPFLAPAKVFDIAEAPDFIQAGDFNADGKSDIAAAARGSNTVHLLAGDGSGNFQDVEAIVLAGRINSMTAGEVNRADGLPDLVVSVAAEDRFELMIFESPRGALRSEPERLILPGAAPALTVGYLDGDHFGDVAAASGRELTMVHGRDRKLFAEEIERAAVRAAEVSRRAFEGSLKSLAVGDFTGDLRLELAVMLEDGSLQLMTHKESRRAARAEDPWEVKTLNAGGAAADATLLCARVSSLSHENLVMFDGSNQQLLVWMDEGERLQRGDTTIAAGENQPAVMKVESAPVAVLPMRLNKDALSDLVILRQGSNSPTILMTQAARSLCVSTLNDCNNCNSLRDAINDANSSFGLDEIVFTPSFSGTPTITLNSPLPSITEAITLDGGKTCGNQLDFNPQAALRIRLNRGGSAVNAINVPSGGTVVTNFVISNFGSGSGVQLSQSRGNIVEGNFIGTDSTGNFANQNARGVFINNAPGNTIGGTANAAINIISGNIQGVELTGSNAVDNVIRLNRIGVSASLNLLGNIQNGVNILGGASRNTIGGPLQSGVLLNIMADNMDGVVVASGTANLIQSNQIDLNRRNGVTINSTGNTVGGPTSSTNGIWRNKNHGVEINGGIANNNIVQGNLIGINFDSGGNSLDRGNEKDGVVITNNAVGNFVGGVAVNAGNIIALNRGNGVTVLSGTRNSIIANRITANGLLSIDLGGDGPTANDDRDGDAGANDLQNFPVLTSAIFSSTSTGDITAAAPGLTVGVNFNSTPSQNYDLDFYFGGDCACTGPQCIGVIPIYLGRRSVTTDATGNFTGSFTFDFTPPATGGFVNATATSSTGSTSELAQCIQVGTQNTCAPICPANQTTAATSAAGAVVNFTQPQLPNNCAGVTVTCDRATGAVFPLGTTTVTCTAREGTTIRGTCSFTVTVVGLPGPTITSAVKSGKKLIVTGTGFTLDGVEMFLNGSKQKKITVNSETEVVSKKAGKNVVTGANSVKIVNSNGTESNEFPFNFQP